MHVCHDGNLVSTCSTLPLSAYLDKEVQENETDMFKKMIAEGEKSVPVCLFFGDGGLQRRRM